MVDLRLYLYRTPRRAIGEVASSTTVDLERLTEEEATLAKVFEILSLRFNAS